MNESEMQIDLDTPQGDLSPDENQALLAFNTNLMETLLPQEQVEEGESGMKEQTSPEGKQEQEIAPKQEEKIEPQKDQVSEMEGKFEQFKEDINKTIDDKFNQVTDLIKQALQDDETE